MDFLMDMLMDIGMQHTNHLWIFIGENLDNDIGTYIIYNIDGFVDGYWYIYILIIYRHCHRPKKGDIGI